MTKTEELDILFKDWETKLEEPFVRDGIISEPVYLKASPKVLFICKEANHNGAPKVGDFRDDWKKEVNYAFVYRLCEWSFGFQNDFPPFDEMHFDQIDEDWHSRYLNAIHQAAFMNVKKWGGDSKANDHEIAQSIEKYKDFIRREIDIIDPDVIVLCLSFSHLKEKLFPDTEWVSSGEMVLVGRSGKRRIIDFYHPSSRMAPVGSYCLLRSIVNGQPFRSI